MADVMYTIDRLARRGMQLGGARSVMAANGHGRVHLLEVRGRGQLGPVVLVHGFSGSAATQYGFVMSYLRPHVQRVIAPDLPGHGLSDLPGGGVTSSGMVDALRDALDSVLSEPATVFGSSLGGALAIRYAIRHPERVARLILCSPAGAPLRGAEREQFFGQFRITSHRDALAFVDSLFATPNRARHVLAWGVRQHFNRPHLAAMLHGLSDDDFLRPEELSALRMPVLLSWGGAERVLPESSFAFFRAHLPAGSVIERPPLQGHAPFLDRPDEVAARIIEFARSARRREAGGGQPAQVAAARAP